MCYVTVVWNIICLTAVCAKLFGQCMACMLERDKEGEGLSCGGGGGGGMR